MATSTSPDPTPTAGRLPLESDARLGDERPLVLIIDDDVDHLFTLKALLDTAPYEVRTAERGEIGIQIAERELPDLILCDLNMPGLSGFEIVERIKSHALLRFTPVLLMTAQDELRTLVEGLSRGADDFISKPYRSEELLARVHSAMRTRALYRKLERTEAHVARLEQQQLPVGGVIGRSVAISEVLAMLQRVKDARLPVLISGESGTGKELIARALHSLSQRASQPFVSVNCAAFQEQLLESELFGHVRGSFTNAIRDKEGLLLTADRGTLFLDEIGEMSLTLQAKLLRVLQEGTFLPVGGTKEVKVQLRVVAATNRDLKAEVVAGRFREDLYYRINGVELFLPPLRARTGDVPLLIDYFLGQIAAREHAPPKMISQEALLICTRYHWPGNIRELQHEVERAVILSGDRSAILPDDFSPRLRTPHLSVPNLGVPNLSVPNLNAPTLDAPNFHSMGPRSSGQHRLSAATEGLPSAHDKSLAEPLPRLRDATEQLERVLVQRALAESHNNKSEAARRLGISRSNLIAKAHQFSIEGGADGDE